MVAYRRRRNLKDELVRAKVRNENDDEKGMNNCVKLRCHAATLLGLLMRVVHSKRGVHTLSTYPLIVIHLEWCAFSIVRLAKRFMSEVLLRLSENCSITMKVVLPGMVKDREVWRVIKYMHIFSSRVTMELRICVSKLLTKQMLIN